MQRLFNQATKNPLAPQQLDAVAPAISPRTISPLQKLHHALGNRAVQRLCQSGVIQRKLRIGAPNDKYEQEADRVAAQVMTMPLPQVQSQHNDQEEEPELQRQAEEEDEQILQTKPWIQRQNGLPGVDEEEEQSLQSKTDPTQSIEPAPHTHAQIESLQQGGQPLPAGERAFFEPRFRRDFSQVRIHHTSQAHQAANAIQAKAFTLGTHIAFNQGQYNPGSQDGRQLLAHELTHVVQQSGADPAPAAQRQQQAGKAAQQAPLQTSPRISHAPTAAQRLGDLTRIPPGLSCPTPPAQVPGETDHIVFANGVSALTPRQRQQLENIVQNWHASGANATVRIDGFASTPGRDELNWRLSCQRAQGVANALNNPSSGITGIANNFIEIYMQGETSEFGAVGNNRRVGIYLASSTPMLPEPPIPGGCITPTAVPGSPTPTQIGSRGRCGGGDDFRSHDFPGVPFALRLRTLYPSMQILPDAALETSMHAELGAFAGTLGTTMATHFDGGSGAPMTYPVGSALSTAVAAAPTFIALAAAIQTEIDNQVGVQLAGGCHIDWTAFRVLPPRLPAASFNVFSGDPLQLQAVLGGTQGLRVLIKDFNLDVTTNTYSATVIIEICDDFGVDHSDMDPLNAGHGSPGLVAFWILQHERPPGHRAFINTVTVESPIRGRI